MEFEILAQNVETWILHFQTNIHDGHSCEYEEIDDRVWNFVWECIDKLESQHQPYCCDLKLKHNLESKNRFLLGARIPHTFKYSPQLRQWLLKIIESIPTDHFFLTLQLPSPESTPNITIRVCSTSKDLYNYICFMQLLFPDPNNFKSVYFMSSKPNFRNYKYQGIFRRWHCTWTMSPDTYQRSLKLFPRWPIVVQSTCLSDEERFEIMSAYMIPDLVKICIAYLPTYRDYDHIRELPQKH